MDCSDTGESGFDKEQIIEAKIQNIAKYYFNEDITNDSPSPSNLLTGLDQIVMLELEDYIMDGSYPLRVLTNMVEIRACEFSLDGFQEDCYEGVDDKPYNPLTLNDFKMKLLTPEYKEILDKIALNMFLGNITDDNPSYINGHTSLEQIIVFKFLDDYIESEEQIIINYTKNVLKSKRSVLEGGSDIRGTLSDILELGEE